MFYNVQTIQIIFIFLFSSSIMMRFVASDAGIFQISFLFFIIYQNISMILIIYHSIKEFSRVLMLVDQH